MDLSQAIPLSSADRMPTSGHSAAQLATTVTSHKNVLTPIKLLKSMGIKRPHSRTANNGSDAKISRQRQGTRTRLNVASRFFADWKTTKNLHIFKSQDVSNSFWRLMYATSHTSGCHRQWRRSSF